MNMPVKVTEAHRALAYKLTDKYITTFAGESRKDIEAVAQLIAEHDAAREGAQDVVENADTPFEIGELIGFDMSERTLTVQLVRSLPRWCLGWDVKITAITEDKIK